MTNPNEREPNPQYLPTVTEGAISNVGKQAGALGWPTFRQNALSGLVQSNECLLTGVADFLTQTGIAVTDREFEASEAAMIVAHQMLAEQARLDDIAGGQDPSKYRLPALQPETIAGLRADVAARGAEVVGNEAMHKLTAQNEDLEVMVMLFLEGSGVRGQALAAGHSALRMVYNLLDRQAKADAMSGQ